MGLRLALGAEPNRLVRLVLHETARSLLLGLALGCLGALALARFLASLLFATATTDPAAYAGTTAVLVLAGLMPPPCRRGARAASTRRWPCGRSSRQSGDRRGPTRRS